MKQSSSSLFQCIVSCFITLQYSLSASISQLFFLVDRFALVCYELIFDRRIHQRCTTSDQPFVLSARHRFLVHCHQVLHPVYCLAFDFHRCALEASHHVESDCAHLSR